MTEDNAGLLEAIELAMAAETKAREFYLDAQGKVGSARGKDLLGQLADFEANHYNKLNELKLSLAEKGEFIEYAGTGFAAIRDEAASEVQGDIGGEKAEIIDILNLAIDAESKARDNYMKLSNDTADPKGKAMFRRLAEEELLHRRILSDEFYHLSNRGEWVWSE